MKKIIQVNYQAKDNQHDFRFGNIQSEYGATQTYFLKNGKPFYPITGEYHFSRYNKDLWERELLKMKASGIDGVAVYVFWNHHEYYKGKFDFSGNRNIKEFLGLCKKHDLIVILRIGPWCHGEVRYGGFPDWLKGVPFKRTNNKSYLKSFVPYWKELCLQIADYMDGKTVVGIQLENEYTGSINHIIKLREIAEEVGFKTPFFTMTMWPTDTPDKRFLPLAGGYPEAPWARHKRPLEPARRFAICAGRSESEIGEDLIKTKKSTADFSEFPYAGCEVGVGNQVTQHRRPIISDKDGYGVCFGKLASGMNWLGYYMYHGGRNPREHLLQESVLTFYPNNYPIIDYDFQSPFSKDGDLRMHGNRLRLLHTFIKTWDNEFARTQAFFEQKTNMPYCSVRCNENGGYVFLSNYERGDNTIVDQQVVIEITHGDKTIELPQIDVKAGSIFFYPYNWTSNGMTFDYITAQPITIVNQGKDKVCYFMTIDGVKPRICVNGKVEDAKEVMQFAAKEGNLVLKFLQPEKALTLYNFDGNVVFSDNSAYQYGKDICAELLGGQAVNGQSAADQENLLDKISLKQIAKRKLPYNYFMYSKGKRCYYEMTIDKELLQKYYDVKITLDFVGLNLQVFWNNELIDDYFNTDGKFVIHTKYFEDMLKSDNKLVIRAAAATATGVGNVYNEINIPVGKIELKVDKVQPIYIVKA